MSRPLALTLGEPAGIGPDITLAIWLRRNELKIPPFYVIADPKSLQRRDKQLGLTVPIATVEPQDAPVAFAQALPVPAFPTATAHAPRSRRSTAPSPT